MNFLEKIENKQEIITISDELDTKYEVLELLKKYPRDTVLLNNIKNSDIPILSGISNTREKIAGFLNCKQTEITQKIIKGMENPLKINKFFEISDEKEYISSKADLSKIPILTHYKKDGGPYITSGVVFARDPDTGIANSSIHRMLYLDKDKLAIRIVPRNLYTYFQRAKELNKDLDIAIAIGLDPATLLATTTSIPINADEMEVANAFKNGDLKLLKCEDSDINVPEAEIILEGKISISETSKEGPFVDLTDTYDVVRDEPVINLSKMHIKKNAVYHSIVPAGFEHRLLQGLPQEPRIFKSVQNTVPTVQNVVLTEGGCCWLHAAIAIKKQNQGDGKNVILAALSAHPSLKHAVVVDEDINIFDPEDIEYAIATRVKGDEDILIIPKARGSSLDPVATPDGTTTKIGVDATKDLTKKEKFQRVSFDY
ncbi:3-octaprenyl-4-hydroxybenzoate carboxy-lyase [Methanobrevibacter curvatus]|uniref:Anhydromevalonate phosphate decarboxylase n=1 Tax=Methanobrevibacter curvatus TaxID=49547 RepID=A0A166BJ13_9EURY|nr:3-octaprenyl-4-hydroxybenzoate carboxy-lyase [Methanobrevibacter curvatus]